MARPAYGTPAARLARSRPLAQGLAGFYPLAMAGGTEAVDWAGALPLAVAGAPWGLAPGGTGLVCNAAGAGAFATVPATLQYPMPMSIAFAFRFLANPSTGGTPLFGIYADNSTGTRLACFESNTPATIEFGSNGLAFTPTVTLAVGVDYVASASVMSGLQSVYVNGAPKPGTTAAIGTFGWTATSRLMFGTPHAFFAPRIPNILVYWCAWWRRLLQPFEHAALGQHGAAMAPLLAMAPTRPVLRRAAVAAPRFRRTLTDRGGSRGVM